MSSQPPLRSAEFEVPDVARSYRFRARYPEALHARLISPAVGDDRLIDLGCGPGKPTLA